MTTPLAAPGAALADIVAALRRRARARWWLALGQVALGVAATFVLPILLILLLMATIRLPLWMGLHFVWILLAILIPLMYLTEWWTRGEFYMEQARYMRNSYGYSGACHVRNWADIEMRTFELQWEILLFAPRQVFEGGMNCRANRVAGRADLARAAEIVQVLWRHNGGMPIRDLQKTGEAPLAFGQAMAHLLIHEWIGVGEAQGGQAWLSSASRALLKEAR